MFTTRPELIGTFGVVSSTHWLASAAGMGILERGGNAFDAAVAAGLVLQLAEPHLNGPGGDLPLLLHNAARNETKVICGQGVAPAAATIERYRELGIDLIPAAGLLATVVPGAFDAWMLLLRDHGSLPLEQIFEPALHYAEHGVPLVARVCETIQELSGLFRSEWTSSATLYLPHNEVPRPGELFANKTLAATWQRLLKEARAASPDRQAQIEAIRHSWREGFVAEAIDTFCREQAVLDTTGERHHGLLSGDDMARWQASYEDPTRLDYGDHTVLKCGPWSQGPVLLQALALLDGFDLAAMDPLGPDFVHTVTECMKLAYADREAYYGDPDFVNVPLETLLSAAYNQQRRTLIGERASLELRPGTVDGFSGRILPIRTEGGQSLDLSAFGVGEPTVAKAAEVKGDTCHVDVIDRWGNMVSATPSGGWLQSSPTIPELGFCLNSRAQMFWLEPGLPASLAPGKRPRTTLTPSLLYRHGEPYMAFGTPGGDQQDQWQLIFLLRHIHHGMNLQASIDAPSFHSEHFPGSFFPRLAAPGKLVLEGRFAAQVGQALQQRGHRVEWGDDWSEGRLCAASRTNGLLKAAANPRGMQGYAVGR